MTLKIGDKVFLRVSQAYLKTSDPMPMLRPPDLVSLEETGEIVALRPLGIAEVKFRSGTFLLALDHLNNWFLAKVDLYENKSFRKNINWTS